MDSQLNTSAWGKPKFLQCYWHNVQRDGGTHSRKRGRSMGAHFSETLFCFLEVKAHWGSWVMCQQTPEKTTSNDKV